jgi:membrane fusion protein, multidrug efflux system
LLEGTHPVEVLAIPRAAVLADQQGSYVLLVGAGNKVEQRRIQTGQSTTTVASVASGLSLGDKVIAEGLQYVKPGQVVAPAPASAAVQATLKQSELTEPAARAIPASSTQGLNR